MYYLCAIKSIRTMKKVLLMMAGWLLTMTAAAKGENKAFT